MKGRITLPDAGRAPRSLVSALGHLPLAAILATGLVLSLFAARTMADLDRERREAEFFRRAEGAVTSVRRGIGEHLDLVRDLARFFDASDRVTEAEFREYGEDVRRRHPDVLRLAWLPGGPELSEAPGAFVVTDPRWTDPARDPADRERVRAGLAAAAGSAMLTAVGPLGSFPASGPGPDILVLHPVYRPAGAPTYELAGRPGELAGYVASRLHLPALVGETTGGEVGEGLRLAIHDLVPGAGVGERLLGPDLAEEAGPATPRLVRTVPFADRQWQVTCVPAPGSLDAPPGTAESLVLAGCLLLTGFSAILLVLARRAGAIAAMNRRQAERLAEEVAERKRAEARYRRLVDGAAFGILHTTAEGRILDVNPALVAMLGYGDAEEVLALDLPRDVYTDPEDHRRLLAAYRKRGAGGPDTLPWRHRDGTLFWVRLTGRRIRTPGTPGESFETMVEDVTAAIRLEEQLRRSRRVEAMGRLAGGVAHDFNNLLTVVLGQCRQLRETAGLPPDAAERVDDIEACGERAARLTRQLLAFARQQVMRPKVLDLNRVLERLVPLLRRLVGETVSLRFDPHPSIGAVRVDPTQIEQVVMNLVLNARNSMPEGGEIRLTTGETTVSGDESRGLLNEPGDYVLLRVEDTGVGMDEETRAHVFEPFFTTRSATGGTGLGLATAFGVVRQSGGFIWVWSEPGEGSAFEVCLPRHEGPVPAEPGIEPAAANAADGAARTGSETILLAEDEAAVLDLIRDALCGEGYTVLPAENGAQAWRIFEEREVEIDALVTDLVMPELGGAELARRLRSRCPDVPVLAMSGYSTHAVKSGGAFPEAAAFIEKPFDLEELLRAVRRMLDGRRGARAALPEGFDGPDEEGPDPRGDAAQAGERGGPEDREREHDEREVDVEPGHVLEPRPGE